MSHIFINPGKPSCLQLILKNCLRLFTNKQTIETILSDFHKLTLAALKIHYEKPSPKIVTYRDHKHFSQ